MQRLSHLLPGAWLTYFALSSMLRYALQSVYFFLEKPSSELIAMDLGSVTASSPVLSSCFINWVPCGGSEHGPR